MRNLQHKPVPECELMLACVRSRVDPGWAGDIRDLLAGVDWDAFLALALEQCVLPVVHSALAPLADSIPPAARDRIHEVFVSIAARNASRTAELTRLAGVMEARGIRVIVFRGPMLAEQLYGDVDMRQFEDLDLLVERAGARAAMDVLEAGGYQPQMRFNDLQEQAYVRFRTELVFFGNQGRVCMDLHWQILPSPFLTERNEARPWERGRRATPQGAPVMTLSDEDTFLFFCVHGAKHGWDKVGRIGDVAAWLRKNSEADWPGILERAGVVGKRRAVLVAMRLANRLLGAPMPDAAVQCVRDDRRVEVLAEEAMERVARRATGAGRQPGDWAFVLGVLEGVRDRLGFVGDLLAPTGTEITMLSLPRPLFGLYSLLRWIRLLWKYTAGTLWRTVKRGYRGRNAEFP